LRFAEKKGKPIWFKAKRKGFQMTKNTEANGEMGIKKKKANTRLGGPGNPRRQAVFSQAQKGNGLKKVMTKKEKNLATRGWRGLLRRTRLKCVRLGTHLLAG